MKTPILVLFVVCLAAVFGLSMMDVKVTTTKVQKQVAAEPFLNDASSKTLPQ
jgi:hypothetical protein